MSTSSNESEYLKESLGDSGIDLNNAMIVDSTFSDVLTDYTQHKNLSQASVITGSYRQNLEYDSTLEGDSHHRKKQYTERKSCKTENAHDKSSTTPKVDEAHLKSVASTRKKFSSITKHVASLHDKKQTENLRPKTFPRSEVINESPLKPVSVTRKIFCPPEKEEKKVLKESNPIPEIVITMVPSEDSLVERYKSQCNISKKSSTKNGYEKNALCFGVKIRSPVAEYIRGRAVVKNSQGRKIVTHKQAEKKK